MNRQPAQLSLATLAVAGASLALAAGQTPATPPPVPAVSQESASAGAPAPSSTPTPTPTPTPAPAPATAPATAPGPYAINTIRIPGDDTARVAAVDFTPDGGWMLLNSEGEIRLREPDKEKAAEWRLVSDLGLEGASGLFAGYWPKSVIVVQSAGISRLFDSDQDGRIDFVKAVAPVWQFGTIGVLFHGSPALLASGEMLLPPRVVTGPLAGSILRLPEQGPPTPWLTGLVKVSAPSPGPDGSWLVAGTRAVAPQPEDSLPGAVAAPFNAIEIIAAAAPVEPPNADASTESPGDKEAPTEGTPGEPTPPPSEKDKAPESPQPAVDATLSPPPPAAAPVAPSPPVPAVAVRVPDELLASGLIPPAFPPDTAAENFGPFSGQGFLAGETSNRLLRFWLEEVDGAWQGGVTDFASIDSLTPGLAFLRYTPDGKALLAGQNGQLLGIQPAGGPIYAVKDVQVAHDGFALSFTAPVDRAKATDPAQWKISRRPLAEPAAPETPLVLDPATTRMIVSADGENVAIQTSQLEPETLYRFDLSSLLSESGGKISHGPVWYTLHRLRPLPPSDEVSPETPVDPATPPDASKPETVPPPVGDGGAVGDQ